MLNVMAVVGRLTADPELRQTPNGINVVSFSIACQRSVAKTGPDGDRPTDFFDVVAWRSTAEFVCKYFRKGNLIAINGPMHTRTYEDKTGAKRKVYEILADNVHFVESKSAAAVSAAPAEAPAVPPARPESQEPVAYSAGQPDDFSIIDDSEDLPF